jgi:MauM/NapG family ferredoxin protein
MLDSIAAPCRESGRAAADRKAAQPPRGWLRPPGALPEPEFLAACTRCTDCIEACPYTAIRRLGPEFGDVAGTPAIIPLDSPCYLCPDMPCIPACKPLALRPTAKRDVTMGLAVLDRTACYVAQGQPCDYCVERCPLKHEAIAFGDDGVPVIDEQRCTGCGVCAYLCPPDAIAVHHRD